MPSFCTSCCTLVSGNYPLKAISETSLCSGEVLRRAVLPWWIWYWEDDTTFGSERLYFCIIWSTSWSRKWLSVSVCLSFVLTKMAPSYCFWRITLAAQHQKLATVPHSHDVTGFAKVPGVYIVQDTKSEHLKVPAMTAVNFEFGAMQRQGAR